MLTLLNIRDYILIESIDLDFGLNPEFCAFTGETGAGKSIILEALNLTLGARAESGVVRQGATQAVISAGYTLSVTHPVHAWLREHGIESNDLLMIRRVLTLDGRSRGYINDHPVSIGLMRRLGQMLVALHGQFETTWTAASYAGLLDDFAGHETTHVAEAYEQWQELENKLHELRNKQEFGGDHQDYLRHSLTELEAANPLLDEETVLLEHRHRAQQNEKVRVALDTAGASLQENFIIAAIRALEKINTPEMPQVATVLAHLAAANHEMTTAAELLHDLYRESASQSRSLVTIDDRLHLLRGLARKHRCLVAALPEVLQKLTQQLHDIDHYETVEAALLKDIEAAKKHFHEVANTLHENREMAAAKLSSAVLAELPALHLPHVRFHIRCPMLPETQWHSGGIDRVGFEIATNQDTPMGALHDIASGGERARLMLALQAALVLHGHAQTQGVSTLIFDEIDNGTGGATAAAIGERLRAVASAIQVIAITHSPQVAAAAHQHWVISKQVNSDRTMVTAYQLVLTGREQELARMLAGAKVTSESQQAARQLLQRLT
jgi:DNA repair protein RecN (Recombination protein N)